MFLKVMNTPHLIINDSFQHCWIQAIKFLQRNRWDCFNLIVHIKEPLIFYSDINEKIISFAKSNNFLTPKHVAYTIFPQGLYRVKGSASKLYRSYNRIAPNLIRKSNNKWGTYFQRMISYKRDNNIINQLQNIIEKINTRQSTSKAAYTIVIEEAGNETVRKMGAPCLNYIAIQLESGSPRKISMLCTYRNHDFLQRAYGNYLGLCNLLKFLAEETDSAVGTITCISSHAYVCGKITELNQLLRSLI